MMSARIGGEMIDRPRTVAFCRTWRIVSLALFGSVLRPDFGPESDIDVLVRFEPSVSWDLFDMVRMQAELTDLFGRTVDLVEQEALVNPYRRKEILETMETVYAT